MRYIYIVLYFFFKILLNKFKFTNIFFNCSNSNSSSGNVSDFANTPIICLKPILYIITEF